MRKILLSLILVYLILLPFFVFPSPALADSCAGKSIDISIDPPTALTKDGNVTATITVNVKDISVIDPNNQYWVFFDPGFLGGFGTQRQPLRAGKNIFTVVINKGNNANYEVTLDPSVCEDTNYQADNTQGASSAAAAAAGSSGANPPTNSCPDQEDADTALGCIPTEPAELVKWILKNAILMGGGIAFLLSIWGGATILLSAGNPEKINEGKEVITSAISGLLFIVLSIFLLRLIGVDILGLPGFSAQ